MPKKYKILIFDLDDTMIDDKENVKYAFQKMLESCGKQYTEEEFYRWYQIDKKFWSNWQDGLIELPEQFKHETGKKSDEFIDWVRAQRVLLYFENRIALPEAILLNNVYVTSLTEVVIPIPGIQAILAYLESKYTMIVATNGPMVAAEEKLNKIDCLKFIDKVLAADMFGYMKPRKEYFEAIQQLLKNYNLDEYLMIGDSLKSDVAFAQNCGFDSCWFDRGEEVLQKQYKPTYTVTKLEELKEIL